MPLKKGHLAMLMASGLMGTLNLTATMAIPCWSRGGWSRWWIKLSPRRSRPRDPGRALSRPLRHHRGHAQRNARPGDHPGCGAPDRVHAPVRRQDRRPHPGTYQPLYDLKPTEEELAILDRLGKQRKALPGQAEAGLAPHPEARCHRRRPGHPVTPHANVQGEMGSGKTTIAWR
jgi:hypothetical protein